MLLATQQDFEPANSVEGSTAMYYEPGQEDGLTGYRRYPEFQTRIDSIKNRFAPNNQKLAIYGCAFGYLVDVAVTAGYDCYGFDASAYAINRGKTLLPAIANRLFVRDALISADVNASKTDAGIRGNNRFALLLTEDLLTCMSDSEITTCLPLLRAICTANLGHIVTPFMPDHTQDPRVNWKTYDQWKTILTPPDLVIGNHGENV